MLIRGVVSSPVRGVVGSGFGEGGDPVPPAGFLFLIESDGGEYVTDDDGAFVIVEA